MKQRIPVWRKDQKLERLHPQCAHVTYDPVRFGVETGVMIGGASQCHKNAEAGSKFCNEHTARESK
jgi:hypothetical protein